MTDQHAEQPEPGADDITRAVANLAETWRAIANAVVAFATAAAPAITKLNADMVTLAEALREAQTTTRDEYDLAPPPERYAELRET